MDDAFLVGVGQRLAHLEDDSQRARFVPPVSSFEHVLEDAAEVAPFDELHGEERAPLGVETELVHRHDPRVVELPGGPGFLHEPRESLRALALEAHLQRQMPLQVGVPRAQDRPHPSARDLALDRVAAEPLAVRRRGRRGRRMARVSARGGELLPGVVEFLELGRQLGVRGEELLEPTRVVAFPRGDPDGEDLERVGAR